jgi:hypothetical protein
MSAMTETDTTADPRTELLAVRRGLVPYPRYGRVAAAGEGRLRVKDAFCGDPRCSAEHDHGGEQWPAAGARAARTYQPRASWEDDRLPSAVTPAR